MKDEKNQRNLNSEIETEQRKLKDIVRDQFDKLIKKIPKEKISNATLPQEWKKTWEEDSSWNRLSCYEKFKVFGKQNGWEQPRSSTKSNTARDNLISAQLDGLRAAFIIGTQDRETDPQLQETQLKLLKKTTQFVKHINTNKVVDKAEAVQQVGGDSYQRLNKARLAGAVTLITLAAIGIGLAIFFSAGTVVPIMAPGAGYFLSLGGLTLALSNRPTQGSSTDVDKVKMGARTGGNSISRFFYTRPPEVRTEDTKAQQKLLHTAATQIKAIKCAPSS